MATTRRRSVGVVALVALVQVMLVALLVPPAEMPGGSADGASPARFVDQASRASRPGMTDLSPGPDVTGCPTDPATPKRQLRAMWITTVGNTDWPSKPGLPVSQQQSELRAWLDLAVARNMNAVFLHVRPHADAFWPSPHEPWSEWLTGVRGRDPGWDPMAFAVAEAHRRNLELHAWFNPFIVSRPGSGTGSPGTGNGTSGGAGIDPNKLAPNHPARAHPDWVVPYPVGDPSARLYYNPGRPEVREFVTEAMMDAVRRYDLDGVHFDDFFYPYPQAGRTFDDGAAYRAHGKGANLHDWRRDNINTFVREMGRKVKAAKPWVRYGISPFGIWRNKATDPRGSATKGLQSYDAIYADTRTWVKEQWIDYVVPQVYWPIGFEVADYATLVPWWSELVAGTSVQLYIGQPAYRVGAKEQSAALQRSAVLADHLRFNRAHPRVTGDVLFTGRDVRADRLGSVSAMAREHWSRPALTPALPGAKRPAEPTITSVRRTPDGVAVSWRATGTAYNIWRVDAADRCAVADGRRLIGTTRDTSFVDKGAGRAQVYYVTALGRDGGESGPASRGTP